MAVKTMEEILSLLCSHVKLERDKGIQQLEETLKDSKNLVLDVIKLEELKNSLITLVQSTNRGWEAKHGGLTGSKSLILNKLDSDDFCETLRKEALRELLGALCVRKGPCIYVACQEEILKNVGDNLERRLPDPIDVAEGLVQKLTSENHVKRLMLLRYFMIQQAGNTWRRNLLDLIFQALNHTNRFVRETGYQLCASLVGLGRQQDETSEAAEKVRLAASVATREFLQTLPDSESRERFYPKILPAMCLNRYYVAEGVRIYSQQSWKMTVEFYISQTKADNHAVREAACACIAELGTKVNPESLRPHVSDLLQALICCFKDDSWPVRDAACVACGNFVLCFPQESSPRMGEFYPLFFENLSDSIPSVRQGAAISLGNVVKAYGESALAVVMGKVREGLKSIEKQEATTEKYAGIEKGPATFGVIKRLRDNDMELHSNKQMYSCGSLAPKMRRGGGCADHLFKRPAQPWEKADGCVDLVAELSSNAQTHKEVVSVIPLVAQVTQHKHYTQHLHLMETVCSQKSDNALTSAAASECLSQLSKMLGPSILRGRVEMHNPRYLNNGILSFS
ncbi:hypothetical protein P5673_015491 [Acropora cervicornis]|uniref:TOG domain-containing protein n=1 Tax=Acropora cervicornis TaxID=6130 RepID=A0AAD9QHZ6_ACRCE|nr:hypothetical protein P5673_015491 [Acropora cervicornis]